MGEELEKVRRDKDCLEKELKASEIILCEKNDELDRAKVKLASSEDVQERLRLQIEKDANQIAELKSKVSELSEELEGAKEESLALIDSYCQLVPSFGGRVDPPDSTMTAKGLLFLLRREFSGLLEFILRASDFAAL